MTEVAAFRRFRPTPGGFRSMWDACSPILWPTKALPRTDRAGCRALGTDSHRRSPAVCGSGPSARRRRRMISAEQTLASMPSWFTGKMTRSCPSAGSCSWPFCIGRVASTTKRRENHAWSISNAARESSRSRSTSRCRRQARAARVSCRRSSSPSGNAPRRQETRAARACRLHREVKRLRLDSRAALLMLHVVFAALGR